MDNNHVAESTLRMNHGHETIVFCQCVQSYIEESKKAAETSPYHSLSIDHVHASSPCQGFSKANTHGNEARKKEKNDLCMTFPDAVISLNKNTGTFENVSGMLQDKCQHYLQDMMVKFICNDYQVRAAGKYVAKETL